MKAFPNDTLGKGVCLVPETMGDNELIRLLIQMPICEYSISSGGREAHVHLELRVKKETPAERLWPADTISMVAALHDLTTPAGSRPWHALEESERVERLKRAECLIPILRKILK